MLAGAGHESITRELGIGGSETYWSKTGFSVSAGIGLDFRINNWISVRPTQVDWLAAKFYDRGNGTDLNWVHRFRYSAGIVFKPGHSHQ